MQYLFDVDIYDEILAEEYEYIINQIIQNTNLDIETIMRIYEYEYNSYDKAQQLLEKIKRSL